MKMMCYNKYAIRREEVDKLSQANSESRICDAGYLASANLLESNLIF